MLGRRRAFFVEDVPMQHSKRIYFDSLVFDPQALGCLIVSADHVCIGTDTPFDMPDNNAKPTANAGLDCAAGTSVCLLSHGMEAAVRELNKEGGLDD